MKSTLLALALIAVIGLIYRSYRCQCRFNKYMKNNDYCIDFTKKVKR